MDLHRPEKVENNHSSFTSEDQEHHRRKLYRSGETVLWYYRRHYERRRRAAETSGLGCLWPPTISFGRVAGCPRNAAQFDKQSIYQRLPYRPHPKGGDKCGRNHTGNHRWQSASDPPNGQGLPTQKSSTAHGQVL